MFFTIKFQFFNAKLLKMTLKTINSILYSTKICKRYNYTRDDTIAKIIDSHIRKIKETFISKTVSSWSWQM